jgi:hypothetical protein
MMQNSASLLLAAVLALSGATTAAASHMSKMSKAPGDTLTLSGDQQKSIWNDVSAHASNQSAPSGFNAAVGTAVPNGLNTYPMPRQAARDVPMARPYRYAMTENKVLIVNPSDHKIADVVTKP